MLKKDYANEASLDPLFPRSIWFDVSLSLSVCYFVYGRGQQITAHFQNAHRTHAYTRHPRPANRGSTQGEIRPDHGMAQRPRYLAHGC
jgi:hypothetical protein